MTQETLVGPDGDHLPPNTNDQTPERGWSFKKIIDSLNTMLTDLYDGINSKAAVSYTAVTADDTAGTVDIDTGLNTITAAIVQILRSDAVVTADAGVSWINGTVTVTDGGSTYAITADDVINVIAIGT